MQANWIGNSQCSPVIIRNTDIPNFSDDWISNNQSNPQLPYFHVAFAISGSSSTSYAGSIGISSGNSSVVVVGNALYSIAVATAIAGSTDNFVGSWILNSTTISSGNNWVSNNQMAPAFTKVGDYWDSWISNNQSSPQGSIFYVIQVGNTLFFGMI